MDDVFQDDWGNWYFKENGQPLTYFDLIARGLDVIGAAWSDSRYVSPDDPRYRRGSTYQDQQIYYSRTNPNGVNVGGSFDPRGGINTNVQISPMMLLIIGLMGGAFVFGRRGR